MPSNISPKLISHFILGSDLPRDRQVFFVSLVSQLDPRDKARLRQWLNESVISFDQIVAVAQASRTNCLFIKTPIRGGEEIFVPREGDGREITADRRASQKRDSIIAKLSVSRYNQIAVDGEKRR